MNDDPRLQQIQQRVETAMARNARRLSDRAGKARTDAAAFVGENPFTAIAGGIAVGMLIGALIPKRKVGAKASALAGVVADIGATLARRVWDYTRNASLAGQKSLEHLGDRVTDGTTGLRKEIGRIAEGTAENVRSAGQKASQQAKSVTGKIGSHLRH